ncbi:hypothetical protein SprV_0702327200 [Sparganum proliferum]
MCGAKTRRVYVKQALRLTTPSTPSANDDCPPKPPLSSSSSSSSSTTTTTTSTASAFAAMPSAMSVNTAHNPDTPTDTKTTTVNTNGGDPVYTCPHCNSTFTLHIGLVGDLRIHCTETGKPVPGAPIYTHRIRLHCPHCPRTFMHRMGLFGHMHIHESENDRSTDAPM